MARLRNLFENKLRSYAVIEVIVALIILLFLFFIVTEFFVSVNKSGFDIIQANAVNVLEEYTIKTKKEKEFYTIKERFHNYTVSRVVKPYNNRDSVFQIELTVYKIDSLEHPYKSKTILVDISQ